MHAGDPLSDPAPDPPSAPPSDDQQETAVDDKILEAGIRAFEAGAPREACPYPAHSEERELWLTGWDEARSVVEEEMEDSV